MLIVLDQLLIVLMLVEILHTVRISIHSHYLVTEPFLMVGLIASIRRIVVITFRSRCANQRLNVVRRGCQHISSEQFELGLLGFLVLVLVISIALLRRYAPTPKTWNANEP
jgi:Phosphate-starvation-inducible E family